MSTSTHSEVHEAELVSANDFNPFAAPTAIERSAEIKDGIGRATQSEINFAWRSLIAAEIGYVAVWVTWMAWAIEGSIPFLCFWLATLLAAWIAFICLVKSCNNEVGLSEILTSLSFPIPGLGFFLYFATKKQAIRFLVWSGYRPVFLGAAPDLAAIARMNSEPTWRPSAWYNDDGSRRGRIWTLSDAFVAMLVVIIFAYGVAIVAA